MDDFYGPNQKIEYLVNLMKMPNSQIKSMTQLTDSNRLESDEVLLESFIMQKCLMIREINLNVEIKSRESDE